MDDIIKLIEEFGASIYFDQELAKEDILGSLAQTAQLKKIGVLNELEASKLKEGLLSVLQQIEDKTFVFNPSFEDIHMNIEKSLFSIIGETAGKLHTGRSRNDQVALDIRLYLREKVLHIIERLIKIQEIIQQQASYYFEAILPGYTHLQRAQPITLAHHLLAYGWMFNRDTERLIDSWKRLNSLPLGSGALAGSTFPLDREFVADILGFERICENSLDGVSDRDFLLEFHADAAIFMAHISRLSEEMILWSSGEFNFLELDRKFCSGSSIMPQKINPDMAELGRGKTGRVYGALFRMLTVMKGLPLAYNKDLQEDKEGVFDTVKTVTQILDIFSAMLSSAKFNLDVMRQAADLSYANATDLADYLARKGLPFREAHGIVKNLVMDAHSKNMALTEFTLEEMKAISPLIENDIYSILKTETVITARNTRGGTSPQQVRLQHQYFKEAITKQGAWFGTTSSNLNNKLSLLCNSSHPF